MNVRGGEGIARQGNNRVDEAVTEEKARNDTTKTITAQPIKTDQRFSNVRRKNTCSRRSPAVSRRRTGRAVPSPAHADFKWY